MNYAKIVATAFFVALVILGFGLFTDYGLSWDEPISHNNGKVSLAYILQDDPMLWTYIERNYGVLFDLPFAFLQSVWEMSTQDLFFVRHLGTFLFFIAGVYVFYRLCLWRWQSRWFALLGAGCLVLSPRIFAEAFYNSKDIPTLVLFIISFYTLSRFLEKPNVARAIPHAIASAALIGIRMPGLLVPFLTIVATVFHSIVIGRTHKDGQRVFLSLASYVVATMAFTILFWPFLWQDPVAHFTEAFTDMSQFSRFANGQVLYLGEFFKASELPWHYIPVWIIITTPLLYLICFLIGIWNIMKRVMADFRLECRDHFFDLVVIAWFFVPIAAIIILHSVVYDGWRHLYFVYPALLYISLLGVSVAAHMIQPLGKAERMEVQTLAGIVLVIHLITITSFMVRSHPYQNVYFNVLAGSMDFARRNFDLDYWGLSFREGLEYIASIDSSPMIPVYFAGGSLDNALILPPNEQKRFWVLTENDSSQAKYILSNYRWQPYDKLPFHWEIYAVKVNGERIMSVFMVP